MEKIWKLSFEYSKNSRCYNEVTRVCGKSKHFVHKIKTWLDCLVFEDVFYVSELNPSELSWCWYEGTRVRGKSECFMNDINVWLNCLNFDDVFYVSELNEDTFLALSRRCWNVLWMKLMDDWIVGFLIMCSTCRSWIEANCVGVVRGKSMCLVDETNGWLDFFSVVFCAVLESNENENFWHYHGEIEIFCGRN